MRKSYPSYSLLTLSGLVFAGSCSIIAEVDRTKIPQDTNPPSDGGQGQGGSRGGSAGSGGSGATTGGTGGDAGGGGMAGEPSGGTTSGGTGGDAGGGMGGAGDGGVGADGGMGGMPSVCGDGEVEGDEDCDDGMPAANDDGCSTSCEEEAGWTCTGEPSTCAATACGDRIQAGAEMCDDGNANACGTCSQNCGTATPSDNATGTITLGATAPAEIDNGDYFTLNDGANPAVEFEFDPLGVDDGVTTGRVEIAFDETVTGAAALQAAIITAINGVTTTLRIQASAGTGTNINLASELFGTIGNQTTGDNVTETSFAISPMAGGAGHDCATGVGCAIDADCRNGDCLTTFLCN